MTLAVLLTAAAMAVTPEQNHPAAFWRQIAETKYAVPAGSDLGALTFELTDMLASPDSELRDDIAYTTLARWIYQTRVIGDSVLRGVIDRLLQNLTDGVGERDTDRIFKRSFSALTLSVVIARDNATPFLTAAEFRRIEGAALAYLGAEHDLRGYEPQHGWMHSAAHTADLLKFLARSRHLDAADQSQILDAISLKVTTSPVFTNGEDERFARAVLSIVSRSDFDRAAFSSWLSKAKPSAVSTRPTLASLNGAQNIKNLLSKLLVLLDMDAEPTDNVRAAHDRVRAALQGMF